MYLYIHTYIYIYTFIGIHKFNKVKRGLINRMSEENFAIVNGGTDSEYIFALFLTFLPNRDDAMDVKGIYVYIYMYIYIYIYTYI
jgi:hypothetical protein